MTKMRLQITTRKYLTFKERTYTNCWNHPRNECEDFESPREQKNFMLYNSEKNSLALGEASAATDYWESHSNMALKIC